jgi:glycogen operon protein
VFATPPTDYGEKWEKVIETAEPTPGSPTIVESGSKILVPDRSLIVLDRTV